MKRIREKREDVIREVKRRFTGSPNKS
jgi:hypothetical protein